MQRDLWGNPSYRVAAAGSPTGGSTLILRLARAGHVRLVATRRVLQEVEHNIRTKMGEEPLLRYYRLLGSVELDLVSPVMLSLLAIDKFN